ncbi:MAG TPA: hypothetical protein VGU74_04650 [Gemmatimonadales bacterium]|nr:hypothetical protein [Gemmatimonadales bacterium]
MRSIFWGVVIIAIGLLRGDSVFRGDFTVLTVAFDALGAFFIIRGLLTLKRGAAAAPAAPAAPAPPAAAPPGRSPQLH